MQSKNSTMYYNNIATKLSQMVPIEWNKIIMYAENFNHTINVLFYFYSKDNKIHFSRNLPAEFHIEKEAYNHCLEEICELSQKSWEEFSTVQNEKWQSLTFILNNDYKFRLKYGYQLNSRLNTLEREVRWAYNELKILPKDDLEKQILEKYIGKKKMKKLYLFS